MNGNEIQSPDDDLPAQDNAHGKVGVHGTDADDAATDPLRIWAGRYTTHLHILPGDWADGPSVILRATGDDDGVTLEVGGEPILGWTYSRGTLAWARPEPQWSGSIAFFMYPQEGAGDRTAFMGRIWRRNFEAATLTLNIVGQRVDDE